MKVMKSLMKKATAVMKKLFMKKAPRSKSMKKGKLMLMKKVMKKNVFTGRLAMTMGRKNRKWSTQALQPWISRGTVPETGSEMRSAASKAKAGVISSSDASPGISSAMRKAGVLYPKGAIHQRREYCTVRVICKADIDDDTFKTLKALTKQKTKIRCSSMQNETDRLFKIVIGNNLAEKVNVHVKNKLRKAGLLGRASDWTASVNSLYAAHVLRAPAFETTLRALAQYRQ